MLLPPSLSAASPSVRRNGVSPSAPTAAATSAGPNGLDAAATNTLSVCPWATGPVAVPSGVNGAVLRARERGSPAVPATRQCTGHTPRSPFVVKACGGGDAGRERREEGFTEAVEWG